jgi:SAM-dependent methyltransferase
MSAVPATDAPRPGAGADEATTCRACGGGRLEVFYEQERVPVHSCRLVETREEALAFPTGTLRLAFCPTCGFVGNVAFEPGLQDYGIAYEETQSFSPTFQAFARELAADWVERHDLRGKTVVEIGCGKGDFLRLLCDAGVARAVGVDPSAYEERLGARYRDRIEVIRELYGPPHAALPADALVCRHTLEHIADVAGFVSLLADGARRQDAIVLFDLPDLLRVLREGAFWDLYYEHCSYFSAGSLARLFRRTGLDVLRLERAYDDQYLVLEARPGEGTGAVLPLEETPAELAAEVRAFSAAVAASLARWRGLLAEAQAAGRRVAVWGAGSKAVAFLTRLAAGGEVAVAVDVNPYKQDKYLAGTGHRVVAPERLRDVRPDLVVAMNAVYVDEIRGALAVLGLDPEVVAV